MDLQSPQPVPVHKGVNPWMIVSLVLFVILVAAGAYYFGKMQGGSYPLIQPSISTSPTSPVAQASPSVVVNPTALPTATNTSGQGSVTGTLCYPASLIPAGTITAKDTTSGKEITQAYAGTQAGAGTTYTLQLPVGTYHMKFTPTAYSSTIGYYTDYSSCVGNPSSANCSGQKTRPLLDVQITAGATVSSVNLCDYYYPPDNPPKF